MSVLLTAIERVTDSVTIESVIDMELYCHGALLTLHVFSEDAREVHPSRGRESIYPTTDPGSPSVLGQIDWGSI